MGQEAEGVGTVLESLSWFPWEGAGEAGRARLGLAGLSDLRCTEAVPV